MTAEGALEPELPVVDAHHHLWQEERAHQPRARYGRSEFQRDLASGHRVTSTVFVECGTRYRTTGPDALRPVGETEWVRSQQGDDGICAGHVGHANLFLGAEVGAVLDAHLCAGGNAFKGVRHIVAWDSNPAVYRPAINAPARALADPMFQAGAAELVGRGLIFETWLYFPQLADVVVLAQELPDLTIVIDHLGGPVCVGPYANDRSAMLHEWRRQIAMLAPYPNVYLKLGGIGFHPFLDPTLLTVPRSSASLAKYWRTEFLYCIEVLTPQRCMFESNFPVDGRLADYVVLWNAYT
ncbi:MAG: amidohydrolase family protein, partial [Acidimicrobiales bacterium]